MFDKDLPRLIPLVCDSVFGPCIFLGHHHHEINVSKGRASFVGSDKRPCKLNILMAKLYIFSGKNWSQKFGIHLSIQEQKFLCNSESLSA